MAREKVYSPVRLMSGDESDQTDQYKINHVSASSRTFSPHKQLWQILGEQMWRLIFTAVLVVLVITVLKVYQDRGTVAHTDKITFNTIITVLNLALGLNFLEAFKDMAKVLRWRVLANRRFTVRETDLILGGESLTKLVTLMRESMRKPLTLFVCICWLAQASIAMIGLTYSMDNGVGSHGITTSRNTVSVPRVDCYYNNGTCTTHPFQPPEVAQNEAHSYGEITRALKSCPYTTDDDIYHAPQDCQYFTNRNGREFAYRFAEYNPKDLSRSYPYHTKRLIKASSGECYSYTTGRFYDIASTDGPNSFRVWTYSNKTDNGTIGIPRPDTAFDSTAYVYNGVNAPQNASAIACGPRCIQLYAVRFNGKVTNRPGEVFKCPITVFDVTNVGDPAHVVPDDTARIAAASIALTGRYTNPNGSKVEHWEQYQLYSFGSHWDTDKLDAQEVGALMARFAIGSLTAMATLNVHTQIIGTLPTLGFHLSIHWRYVIALAACIAGVHCLLVGLILWIARPVVVPADSNLVTARLLQPLVSKIGEHGGLLEGKEIAEAIEREGEDNVDGKGTVGYGIRERPGGTVLEVGEGTAKRKKLDGGRFPGGTYA
ncbi:MAG: hypothetical protein Q9181_003365 [Wetmoreana brouardii]